MSNFIHENEYRGQNVVSQLAERQVVICGAGAIGSLLADNLVRQGFGKLRVIDRDRVDSHNVNTQLYGLSDVGSRKAEVLRNRLFRAVEIEIEAVSKELNERNAPKFLRNADVVVDAFDNSESRQLVQDFCRSSGTPCLHVGLFAGYGEIVWDEQYVVPKDAMGDVCEYPLARNTVLLAVGVASEELVRFCVHDERRNLSLTIEDFAVRELEPAS